MTFEPSEIELIIGHYACEIDHLEFRLDCIKSNANSDCYDDDLRDTQIHRIHTRLDELEARIEKLEDFKKEL